MRRSNAIFAMAVGISVLIGIPSAAQAQKALAYGSWMQDSIAPVGTVNSYTFTGTAGDIVKVLMGTKNFSFHPRLEVYAPAGTLLAVVIDSTGFTSAKIDTLKLPASGTYTILAADCCAQNSGVYGISIQKLNPGQNVKPVANGISLGDTIKGPGCMRGYTFSGAAKDTIAISMVDTNYAIRPTIQIYTPSGALLKKTTDTTTWGSNRISAFELPVSGTYTVICMDWAGVNPGYFALNFSKVNTPVRLAPVNSHASSFGFGQVTTGEKASVAFSLPRAMVATVSLTSVSGKKIAVLASGETSAGTHEIRLGKVPAGVYLCKLQTPGHDETITVSISR